MNYILDYYFSDKFINGFDFNKLPKNAFIVNLDTADIQEKSYETFTEKDMIGVWKHPKEMTSKNTKFFSLYEILDKNNKVKKKFKDKNFFYKIDMFGSPEASFPNEFDSNETVIDFLSYRCIDALVKNKNIFLLLNYFWEGILATHKLNAIHKKLHQYKIPPKKVVFSFGGFNQKEWYETYCREHNVKNKINFHYHNWVWNVKSTEYNKYRKQKQLFNRNNDKLNESYKIEKKKYDFNCLNRRLRTHRFYVLAMLQKENLLDKNIVTYDFTIPENRPHLAEIPKIEENPNDEFDFTELKQHLLFLQKYKDKKTYDFDDLENISGIMNEHKSIYEDSMFTFVTETTYYADEFYISEKTLKPIGHSHPFLVFGSVGTLRELKNMGFKTFEPFIDESYDLETDMQKRIDMIFDEIFKLVNKSDDEKIQWMENVKPIVDFNTNKLNDIYLQIQTNSLKREWEINKLVGINYDDNKMDKKKIL